MTLISRELHHNMRIAYALRRVPKDAITHVIPCPREPVAGMMALGTLTKIGKNARLELASGRLATLHEGDTLALAFGNRYATAQFEGYAGTHGVSCDLLSAGGLCGVVTSRHAAVAEPSTLRLFGVLAGDDERPLRLSQFAIPASRAGSNPRPQVVVVCGTSMDSGKTHTAMSLIMGLQRQGHRVAGLKLTGTAAGRDTWAMQDAGACVALDFVDGGFPSTYLCEPDAILDMSERLIGHAAEQHAEWIVVEIADGLLQRETAALLQSPRFMAQVTACVFTTGDSLGALGGVATLDRWGITPVAVCGLLTLSPLGMREATAATGIRCVTAKELQAGALNDVLTEIPLVPRISIGSLVENDAGRAITKSPLSRCL